MYMYFKTFMKKEIKVTLTESDSLMQKFRLLYTRMGAAKNYWWGSRLRNFSLNVVVFQYSFRLS